MRIYPTIYRYNASYRGPKDSRELNKVVTSIKYDIGTSSKVLLEHQEVINSNLNYLVNGKAASVSNINPTGIIGNDANGEVISCKFRPIQEVSNGLNSISTKLDNILKNL